MKTTTNILKTLTLIIVAILVGVSTTYALGTLQPSSAPADTQYSLNDLYTKLTDFSATTTEDTGDITIPGSITTSFHTLAEIYGLMEDEESDLIPGNIADGVTVFGVEGTLVIPDTNTVGPFTDNEDGTATDQNTGLMWTTEDAPDLAGYCWDNTVCEGSPAGAVEYCANLSLADFSDWRLPSYQEWTGISDLTTFPASTLPGSLSAIYWSVTEQNGNAANAWSWDSSFGDMDNEWKDSNMSVRCVRG